MKKFILIFFAGLLSTIFPLIAFATPAAPHLDETQTTIEVLTYVITGSGEAGARVFVDDDDTLIDVEDDGTFAVQVDLSGEGITDTFTITLQDSEGNMSPGTDISITCWREGNSLVGASVVSSQTGNGTDSDDDSGNGSTSSDQDGDEYPFTDIQGHWAEEYILQLYEEGIVTGYSDGTFRPDNPITRAEVLKIALEKFGLADEAGESTPFVDLQATGWYYDYVRTGWALAVINGYEEDHTFRPNNNITRAEALRIMIETSFLSGSLQIPTDTSHNLADVKSSDWFAHYSSFATEQGIVQGYSDHLFHGDRDITRAQVCKIVVLLSEYLETQAD